LNRHKPNKPLGHAMLIENLNLVLNAASSLGIAAASFGLTNIQLLDSLNSDHIEPVTRFLWELIRTTLLREVDVKVHPELSRLLNDEFDVTRLARSNSSPGRISISGPSSSKGASLSPEMLLLRWLNYHLKPYGIPPVLAYADDSLQTCDGFYALLDSVSKEATAQSTPVKSPSHAKIASARSFNKVPVEVANNPASLQARAAELLKHCQTEFHAPLYGLVTPEHIVAKDPDMCMAVVASIFAVKPGLPPLTVEEEKELEKAGLLTDDVGDDREERAFRMWINSSGISTHIHNLFMDCRDGIVLLQMIDKIEPGLVNWKKVELKEMNPFKAMGNNNYAITLCKTPLLNFSLVGIAGSDIYEAKKKLVLALVWQLMRYHTIKFLKKIRQQLPTEGKVAVAPARPNMVATSASDDVILQWANGRITKALQNPASSASDPIPTQLVSLIPSRMTSFKDSSLKNSLYFLTLLWSVEPRVIDWALVKKGDSKEDCLLNAGYTISVARKLGATVFLLPEDVLEVRPKMILTLVASIMSVASSRES